MVTNNCAGCNQKFVSRQRRKYCEHSCYAKTLIGKKLSPATCEKLREASTGRVYSAESRAKISKALKGKTKVVKHDKQFKKGEASWIKGRKHTPETISKLNGRASPSKDAHWNWKGGITELDKAERVKFRQTTQKLVLVRDNYTCQICDQYSGYLQVDHIKSWAEYPELRFDLDNCRTLCMACHYYVTFKKKMPKGIVWGHNLRRRIAS